MAVPSKRFARQSELVRLKVFCGPNAKAMQRLVCPEALVETERLIWCLLAQTVQTLQFATRVGDKALKVSRRLIGPVEGDHEVLYVGDKQTVDQNLDRLC